MHANNARSALSRLASCAMQAGAALPWEVTCRGVVDGISLVLHMSRRGGKRFIEEATHMALCVQGKETSAHLVRNKKQRLVALAAHVKTHVDKTLAHAGKEQPEHPATFEDLNTVLDELAGLIASYRLELEAVMFEPEPVLQGDWSSIFEVPWIDDGDKS